MVAPEGPQGGRGGRGLPRESPLSHALLDSSPKGEPLERQTKIYFLFRSKTCPEERQELDELFALPPEDRAAIHLYYYEGYSTEEIAQMTGQRPGTVRSRLSRARQKLKKLLEA